MKHVQGKEKSRNKGLEEWKLGRMVAGRSTKKKERGWDDSKTWRRYRQRQRSDEG